MKANVMTVDEMAEQMETEKENKHKGKIYSEITNENRNMIISSDIRSKITSLQKTGKQLTWEDTEEVRERTYNYFEACAKASVIPTLNGLASLGFGVSRIAMYNFMRDHPNSPTTEFLTRVKDIIADILQNGALKGQLNPVMSIFVLKNGYGFSDKQEPEIWNNDKKPEIKTPEELKKALERLPIIDE